MDYGLIDVLSTSQRRPATDASLGVTYRTIWGRPKEVMTFLGDVFTTSSGCSFADWVVFKVIRNVLFYRRLISYQSLCIVVVLNMITMFLKKHPYFHLFVDQDLEIFSKTELPWRLFCEFGKIYQNNLFF